MTKEEEKAKAEGAVEALEHIKQALCSKELTTGGRSFVNNLINTVKVDFCHGHKAIRF